MSLLKTGLLQLSPESIVVGEVTYYDRGLAVVDRIDRESIAEALGLTSKVITVSCALDSSSVTCMYVSVFQHKGSIKSNRETGTKRHLQPLDAFLGS